MPIDASIPLSFRPNQEIMSPAQMVSLQSLAQAGQENQRKNAIHQILQSPGAVGQNGMLSPFAIQGVAQQDPVLGIKLSEMSQQLDLRNKAIQQKKTDRWNQIEEATVNSYQRELQSNGNPKLAEAKALETRQGLIKEFLNTGEASNYGFTENEVNTIDQKHANIPMAQRMASVISHGGKITDEKAPRTRNRIQGDQEIQEEFDPTTNTWKQVGKGPRFKPDETKGGFEGKNGELLAALAEKGVSLPAGFRSKTQQLGLLNSLRERNPSLSPDEIADKVKNGQIDLANVKKAGQVAAGIAGKVAYAENELEQTIPLVREASAKLPRGKFIPFNKLKQMSQDKFSNPDLAEFRMYMTSLSNAYDMLAARGGTDVEKRAEGRRNFETAQSPEALEAVLRAVQKEAQASGRAAQAAMKPPGSKKEQEKATSKSGRPMHKNEDGKWEYD